jgi:hypothetical protein
MILGVFKALKIEEQPRDCSFISSKIYLMLGYKHFTFPSIAYQHIWYITAPERKRQKGCKCLLSYAGLHSALRGLGGWLCARFLR